MAFVQNYIFSTMMMTYCHYSMGFYSWTCWRPPTGHSLAIFWPSAQALHGTIWMESVIWSSNCPFLQYLFTFGLFFRPVWLSLAIQGGLILFTTHYRAPYICMPVLRYSTTTNTDMTLVSYHENYVWRK